jgi:hypothetical protein
MPNKDFGIKSMAARKVRTKLSEEWRERIRSGVILQRLEKAAMGELEMSSASLKAAEIVLRKTIPDLARTEHTGQDNGPIKMQVGWRSPE